MAFVLFLEDGFTFGRRYSTIEHRFAEDFS